MEESSRYTGGGGLPLGPGVRILGGRDAQWLAFEKPTGVMTHPNDAVPSNKALLCAPYDHRKECYFWEDETGKARQLHLIHRLDSPTSGVLLACLDPELAVHARRAFAQRTTRKVYQALVIGCPRGGGGIWVDRWQDRRATRGRGSKTRDGGGVARARCEILGSDRAGLGLTALRLTPETGRTHQLRIQCQRRAAPIVGDQQYGAFRRNRELSKVLGSNRLFLHAMEIEIPVSGLGGRPIRMRARSPLPIEFSAVFGRETGQNRRT